MTPLSPQTPVGKTKPSSVAANENATTGECEENTGIVLENLCTSLENLTPWLVFYLCSNWVCESLFFSHLSTCLWMVADVTPGVHEVTKQGRRKNEVSLGVFYGSPTGNPSRRPFQVVRLLHEIQNDLALQKAPKPRYMVLSCPKEWCVLLPRFWSGLKLSSVIVWQISYH